MRVSDERSHGLRRRPLHGLSRPRLYCSSAAVERVVGDVLPAVRPRHEVWATDVLLGLGHRRSSSLQLEDLLVQRRRADVTLVTDNQQKRRTLWVAEVDRGG